MEIDECRVDLGKGGVAAYAPRKAVAHPFRVRAQSGHRGCITRG